MEQKSSSYNSVINEERVENEEEVDPNTLEKSLLFNEESLLRQCFEATHCGTDVLHVILQYSNLS